MKKMKLITNQKEMDKHAMDVQEAEIQRQLNIIRDKITVKANERQEYILIDGVMLPLLERALNELVPESYQVSEIFNETFMAETSNLLPHKKMATVTMYYILLKRRSLEVHRLGSCT